MKVKRILALVLAVVMIAAMMAGCGGKKDDDKIRVAMLP